MQQTPNTNPQFQPRQQRQQPPMPPQQPPYQQQQYQQPPQYLPSMPPPKKKSRTRLWLILVAVVLVLAVIIGVASKGQSQNPAPAAQGTQPTLATKQPTLQPTTAPTTKPTPKPTVQSTQNLAVTHGTPHLGGPISDFIGAYGQPNDHSNPGGYASQYHFQRDTNTTDVTDGLIVSTSADSKSAVDDISVAAVAQNATYNDPQAGSSFSPSDAKARCMTFAPSDARFKQKFVYADNSGYDMVYTSASLAQSFQAADFTDSQSNQVQTGMFDVSYLYKSNGDTQHIVSCEMIIGEQQTTN